MKILYNSESREALKKGVDAVANAVKVTLGPSGKNVILANGFNHPVITKDGVSIAREIYVDDPIENVGAQMIKQAAINTNKKVGDGTTTATVLAQAALNEGFKQIENGKEPFEVAKELREGLPKIVKSLKESAIKVENKEQIYNVAMVSTNGDERLATLISNAYEKVEDNIVFENNTNPDTILEILEGMRFNSTYLSTYFITDSEQNNIVLEDGNIFIYNTKLTSVKQIKNAITKASQDKRPLVIITDDIDSQAVLDMVKNNKTSEFQCIAISSPGFGFGRQKTLEDISIYTGAEIYKKDTASPVLGRFDKIVVDSSSTTITGMYGDKDAIDKHIQHLELVLDQKENDEEAKLVKERLSKFKKGIGIIKIGASSQLELKERKDRLEDAINAVSAAVEGGVVAGGGMTLFLESFNHGSMQIYDEENTLYKKILVAPHNQILENSGMPVLEDDNDSWITEHELVHKDDFKSEKIHFQDYIKAGIIDPVLVTITALENAISVASTILTTECMVVEDNINNPKMLSNGQ